MKDTFELGADKRLYLRLPEGIEAGTEIHFVLSHPSYIKPRLIEVRMYDCDIITPFKKDAIKDERDDVAIDYVGDDDYWKPKEAARHIVDGHPNCDYDSTCYYGCQVASCGIHLGFEHPKAKVVKYLKTTRDMED